ncbi:PQQ-binding-like beta-propeller repeat protein [Kitasatospora sp. NPDC096140]|uniref:outer membrane protein assembly factor BamB family protein n=1 Tax=Kitasatospora sp. NPDC096140 TaxID=3155425 RepID=UPI00333367BB
MVTELWERVLHQRGAYSQLALAGERVVVHERRTRLVCLGAADGTPLWDVPAVAWPRALVVVGRRVLVLPQDRDVLACLALTTGELLWQAEVEHWTGQVAVADGVVLVGGWRGYTPLAAFDLTDGRPLWRSGSRATTERPVAWAGGFLLGHGARAWLVDPRDGRESASWELPRPLTGADGRPVFTVVDADRCAVGCDGGAVVVLRADGRRPELLTTHEGPLLGEAPLLVDGVLWLREVRAAGAGYVTVDPLDGTRRWRAGLGTPAAQGVVGTAGGTVLASEGGRLFRLDAGGGVAGRERLGGRIAAVHDLGAGRLLTVTRNSLRAWRL